MSSLDLKLSLPDSLAREVEANGLLTPDAIVSLLREEIRRRRVDKLCEAAVYVPLTEDEVEAEIAVVREEPSILEGGY